MIFLYMNYILEDNIDFYKELNELLNDYSKEDNICLLSKQPLGDNLIKLDCNHSFNLEPLYREVINQKNNTNHYSNIKLSVNQIKCPYCRKIHNKLLPNVVMNNNMKLINGVNSPSKYCMKYFDCDYKLKSGKNKGNNCQSSAFKSEHGCFCRKHMNMVKNTVKPRLCEKILKSGKRKGECCNRNIKLDNQEYCTIHNK